MSTTSSRDLLRTLGLVAAVCGLLIAVTQQLTAPAIAANKKAVLERTVRELVPAARTVVAFDAAADSVRAATAEPAPDAVRFHAAYDARGQLAAIVAEGASRGYADLVRVLYAYDPGCQCGTGMRVIQMRETPGIGDRVLSDPDFIASFARLDLQLADDGARLRHPVTTVRHGNRRNAWEIDAISGATITSRAIGRAIDGSAQTLMPRLRPRLEQITGEQP